MFTLMQVVSRLVAGLVSAGLVLSLAPAVAFSDTRADRADVARASFELFEGTDRPARTPRSTVIPGEAIVKLKGSERFERVRGASGESVEALLAHYRGRADIEYAEPNYTAHAFAVPNDTYYQYQWHFDNPVYGGVEAEQAWEVTNGNGIVVAVVDTGVAYEDRYESRRNNYALAPDFAGTTFVPGYDFVNGDSHPNDDEGHGTHVAATIAQTTNNGSGTAGLAYGAAIMPVKVLNNRGSGSYADIAAGIRFAADNGADVINLSLGGSVGTTYLEEAVAYAHGKGVTIVAASGNDNSGSVSYPAAYNDYVIAVGATRFDETRAPYSNYGSALDLVAPGGDLGVDQNGDGFGDGVLQQTFGSSPTSFGYYFYQGTSMASPHVAAAAAMVLAAGKASTPAGVQALLQNTADDLGANGRDNTYGHGLINLARALSGSVPEPDPEPDPEPTPDYPPQVAIATPVSEAVVSGEVLVSASSSDDNGVVEVEFSIDGVVTAVDTTSPYQFLWDTTEAVNGLHFITATARDTGGQAASSTIVVTVDNQTPDPDPEPDPDPTPTTLLFESFESGFGDWTQGGQGDWRVRGGNTTDGSQSAQVDGRATDAQLVSPTVSLTGYTNATVSFDWLIDNSFDSGEYLAFDVSFNGGATWQEEARLRGNVDSENVWFSPSFDVSGQSSVRLRFRGTMSSSNEDAYVDAVQIVAE